MNPSQNKSEQTAKEIHETKKYATVNDSSFSGIDKDNLKYLQAEGTTWESLGIEGDLSLQLKTLGYKRPSNVQSQVLKTYKKMRRVFVQSQNGSGKTLAFSIPAISICQPNKMDNSMSVATPQVLILADTNVLVLQLKGNFLDIFY